MRPGLDCGTVAGLGRARRAQGAIEFLTTYGWAIMIIVLALAVMYTTGILNPGSYGTATSKCTMPADFYCQNATLSSTGNLVFTIGQSTSAPIYVTAIGCNSVVSTGNMFSYAYPGIFLPIGSNFTTYVQCYSGGTKFSGAVGALYGGYLILTYNNINTGFNQTVVGTLSEKVVH